MLPQPAQVSCGVRRVEARAGAPGLSASRRLEGVLKAHIISISRMGPYNTNIPSVKAGAGSWDRQALAAATCGQALLLGARDAPAYPAQTRPDQLPHIHPDPLLVPQ